jgi:dTDP-4-amino-4,6-dideoxygalactose transaminase
MIQTNDQNEPIQLNNFTAQWSLIKEDVYLSLERVGRSGWLILGNEVAQFESDLANKWGTKFCVGVGNGLDAIEIALRALKIRPGERVLTTPLSAFATSLAIVRAGGVPTFVDVDESGLINIELARRFLVDNRDVRFFIPVHLYGHPVDYNELLDIKTEFDLLVVEDCAQSIGATSAGFPVGTLGQIATTSFYPTKNLGCLGDGGAILTNCPEMNEIGRVLRDYGQSKKYVHSSLGLNSRLDELQAAILRTALLPRLELFTAKRRKIARSLCEGIINPNLRVIKPKDFQSSVWHLFGVLVNQSREDFRGHLALNGISSAIHYPILIPDQEALRFCNEPNHHYSMARNISTLEVTIPAHPFLTDEDVSRIIEVCNSWDPK